MAKQKGRGLTDFRKAHSQAFIVPEKIRAGLAELGADAYEYEGEFMKRIGVGGPQIARYREQFGAYVVVLPHSSRNTVASAGRHRHAWAGSTKLATKMRETLAQ
jgi:hypothetical protein